MPFGIRHMYRKLLIYATILAALLLLTLLPVSTGVAWQPIALVWAAVFLFVIFSYGIFNHASIWLRRGKVITRADEPRIFHVIDRLSKSMSLRTPKIVMIHDPVADVFSGGASRGSSMIFVTSGFISEFQDSELEALLTPEMEAIAEMGGLVYNMAMKALSGINGAAMKQGAAVVIPDTGDPRLEIDFAKVSDVPPVVRSLIANGMYNYLYLHELNRMALRGSPFFIVARYQGKPVGLAIGQAERAILRPRGHLSKIVVDVRCRGNGVGQRLLRDFIHVTAQSGCDRCYIEVRVDNSAAISLYEKLDFNKVRVIPAFYPDGTDCMIMDKKLGETD